jgi:hypothetical protein
MYNLKPGCKILFVMKIIYNKEVAGMMEDIAD